MPKIVNVHSTTSSGFHRIFNAAIMVFYSRASPHTCRDGGDCEGSNEEENCLCHGAVANLEDRCLLEINRNQFLAARSVTSARAWHNQGSEGQD